MKNAKRKIDSKQDVKYKSYILALDTIRFIDQLNQKDFSVIVIVKQLLRSITSIGANIVEAQASSSKKDFANFFSHSLKSANESKFWLALLRDSKKADPVIVNELINRTEEISNILGASIITIKKSLKK